jgi:cold shock CspA family protein
MTDKGYGWLEPDDADEGARNLFCHAKAIRRPRLQYGEGPVPGTRVQFEREVDPQGRPRAINAELLS